MCKRVNVAGRFLKVSDNPIVIGTIGNVYASELPKEQLEYIKAFCGAAGKHHKIVDDFPVSINRSMYNEFIVIE